jgi:hypothetical protein
VKVRYKIKQTDYGFEFQIINKSDFNKELLSACTMPAHTFSENEIRRMLCTVAFGLGCCLGSVIGVML